jgi:hypothetical protein
MENGGNERKRGDVNRTNKFHYETFIFIYKKWVLPVMGLLVWSSVTAAGRPNGNGAALVSV